MPLPAACLGDGAGVTGGAGEDYLRFLQSSFEAFPDVRYDVLDLIAEDRQVATRFRMTGTHEGEFLVVLRISEWLRRRWASAW